MSKRGYISRYMLILKKLNTNPYSSFEELKRYMEKEFEILQMQDDNLTFDFSIRTLQRDIREIRNVFGIDIDYSRANKGYYISHSEAENMNFQRRMEAFDMFNSLNLSQDLLPYIHLENRKPQGTENLYGILHAIKNRFQITFTYQKFWQEVSKQRTVEPYALKEFKNRWYIRAKDLKDNHIKSFALDRLTNLYITKHVFQYPDNYSVEESFKYCFGIIRPDSEEEKPQDIVLLFNVFQGKYIKTLPLHETQEILEDNEHETKIQLRLYPTHDFIMELLSFGNNVKVIKPKYLANQIKKAHEEAFELY